MYKSIATLMLLPVLLFMAACGDNLAAKKPAAPKGESNYMLGLSYLRQQQLTAALKEFMQAVAADPQNAEFQNALAQAYQFKQAYPQAEEHYLKALALSGGNPRYQNNIAALYLDMRRWDDAIQYFRAASSNLLFGSQAIALTGMGVAYFQKGEYAEAIAACQEAIKNNSRFAPAYLRMGEAYHALGKWEEALAAYHKSLDINPDSPEGHYRLGLAYLKTHQNDKAVVAFSEVLRLAPTSEFATLAKGFLETLK